MPDLAAAAVAADEILRAQHRVVRQPEVDPRVVLLDPLRGTEKAGLFAVPRRVDKCSLRSPPLLHEHPERTRRVALYSAYVYDEQVPSFFAWAQVGGIGDQFRFE